MQLGMSLCANSGIARVQGMSALCQKRTHAVQQTEFLFDHLIGDCEQVPRYAQAEHFGGLETARAVSAISCSRRLRNIGSLAMTRAPDLPSSECIKGGIKIAFVFGLERSRLNISCFKFRIRITRIDEKADQGSVWYQLMEQLEVALPPTER